MLRVGFLFRGDEGWLGGVNYLRNLLFAIGEHAHDRVQAVLVAEPGAKLFGLERSPHVEIASVLPAQQSIAVRSFERRVLGSDAAIVEVVGALKLDVVSHSGTYGWRFPVPTVPWIPDLQHHCLPHYFSLQERALRSYADVHQLVEGAVTVVSSEAAQADCARFYGSLARRTRVVHFVSQPRSDEALPSRDELRQTLDVPERYFFLPNQFWRHKNHVVVIEALELLAKRNVRPVVLMTGKADDYRAPGYYELLVARIKAAEVDMRHLGLLPFAQVGALMRDSIAVINPSYFEGWSSTVEEARSLGKATILSDIAVHREQKPPGASFFAADDPRALASELERAFATPTDDAERARAAAEALPVRTKAFASTYLDVVRLALESRRE